MYIFDLIGDDIVSLFGIHCVSGSGMSDYDFPRGNGVMRLNHQKEVRNIYLGVFCVIWFEDLKYG